MQVHRLVLGELASNCYILEFVKKQCVIIDIGEGAPTLLRFLEHEQLKPYGILLTHGHYDHIAGVEQVREKYDIPVYIHSLDVPMLGNSQMNLADWLTSSPFRAVKTWHALGDGDVLQFGTLQISVLHTPGHTMGSVCYLCEDMLFTGDTLFHLSRGRTDFPGGSDEQMLDSFRKLKKLEGDYRVLPGHDAETTLSYEKMHNPTMRGL